MDKIGTFERDALRYRWLRKRIEIREVESAAGDRRPALRMRLGLSFVDSPGPLYTSVPTDLYEQQHQELDTVIDAALAFETEAKQP